MTKITKNYNWQTKNLGDVCGFVRGPFGGSLKKNIFTPTGYAVYEQQHAIYNQFNNIRYFVDDKKFNEMKRFEINSGNLIMSCSGTMGKVAIVPNDAKKGIINQALLLIKPDKNLFNKFLKLWMESEIFQESLKKHTKGAAIKNVASVKILKSTEISFPPLSEQNRIVKILDEIFEKIEKAKENTEKNLKNSNELFESYMKAIFGDRNWRRVKLKNVCKYEKEQNKYDNLPYVGLEHIQSNTGKFIGSLSPKTVKSNTFHFTKHQILYGRLRPYLNKVLLPNFEGHCSTEIFPISTTKELNRKYLFYWLIAKSTVQKINATWTGARMPRANMNEVLEFEFPLPPVSEQEKTVKKLDQLSEQTKKLEENYTQKLLLLEELRKSLLVKAFVGEL